jgi:energy-coupling factor transporter transmembrane protein EcfT
MTHQLPEYAWIVAFIASIIAIFIVANVVAAIAGYREK